MNSIKAIEKPRPMAKLAEKKHVSQHQVSIVPNKKKLQDNVKKIPLSK